MTRRGFALVEDLVVMVIMAIPAMMATNIMSSKGAAAMAVMILTPPRP